MATNPDLTDGKEELEDRTEPKMAGSAPDERDALSAHSTSADGARPGQLGAVGYFGQLGALYRWAEESTAGDQSEGGVEPPRTERSSPLLGSDTGPPRYLPNHELFHECAARSKGGLVRSRWVRAANHVKGKAVSRAGASCPNCCAFFATRDALAHHQCERYREERLASEFADRLGLTPKRHRGAVSAQWHPAFDAGTPQTHISGVPVASLMGANRGLNGGRAKAMVYDGETSKWKWRQSDLGTSGSDGFLVEGGWGIERLKSDQPAHRPKTAISDPRQMVDRFLILLREVLDVVRTDADPELVLLLLRIGNAVAEPSEDLGVVADILKPKGRGRSKRTLENERKELRKFARSLVVGDEAFNGAAFLRALAHAPGLVTFVSRLRITR